MLFKEPMLSMQMVALVEEEDIKIAAISLEISLDLTLY